MHRKMLFLSEAYPIKNKIVSDKIEPSLTLAIIRQESMFDPKAESTAKAQGLMQLIPQTAKESAKILNIKHNSSLIFNPNHNIKLGNNYLNNLLSRYKGSYILTIAAYNAGPHVVDKWLKQLGDVRKLATLEEVIDWLELVPYYETRNYLHRTLENIQIYRHRFGDKSLQKFKKDLLYLKQTEFKKRAE